jgi:hypothetical protein
MDMSNRGIRRWALLGALASGALLAACEKQNPPPRELDTWPKTGVNEREGRVNDAQDIDTFGPEQPARGGSGFEQEPPPPSQQRQEPGVQGAPGSTTPREDGRGAEVLRDGPTEGRNQGGEGQR